MERQLSHTKETFFYAWLRVSLVIEWELSGVLEKQRGCFMIINCLSTMSFYITIQPVTLFIVLFTGAFRLFVIRDIMDSIRADNSEVSIHVAV